ATGTSSGRIDLFGNIAIDTNAADTASLSMTGSGAVLNASITIDTEDGNDGDAGSVDLSGAPLSAAAFGLGLTIHTNTAAGGASGGAVTLGDVNGTLGTAFINDISIDADGPTDGVLTLRGDILLDADGGNTASFGVAGSG